MLSRTKKQLSLAVWWNREFWHEIYEGVGDNEGDWGEGRGRRFLRRLGFHSCAAALPLVGKPWVRDSPKRRFNNKIKTVGQTVCILISQGVIQRKKYRKRNSEVEGERDGAHTLNIDNVWFFSSTFSSEPGTSGTRLFLNCPTSTGTPCSHIFHPFPDRG